MASRSRHYTTHQVHALYLPLESSCRSAWQSSHLLRTQLTLPFSSSPYAQIFSTRVKLHTAAAMMCVLTELFAIDFYNMEL